MDSPPCKRKRCEECELELIEAQNEIEYPPSVTKSEEDYFSKLPGDCISAVFSFLNQLDLDYITPLSQTIRHHVNRARPTVPRSSLFHSLEVKEHNLNQYQLRLIGQTDEISTFETENGQPLSFSEHIDRCHRSKKKVNKYKMPQSIHKKINFALQRFDVKNIELSEILIFDLDVCEICKWSNARKLTIAPVDLDTSPEFLRYALIESRIKHVCLVEGFFGNDLEVVNNSFIEQMSGSVANPSVEVTVADRSAYEWRSMQDMDDEDLEEIGYLMGKATLEALSLFTTARIPHMPARTDDVMECLMKRLRRKQNGEWEIATTRMLERADVSKGLDSEFMLVDDERSRQFTIMATVDDEPAIVMTIRVIPAHRTSFRDRFQEINVRFYAF